MEGVSINTITSAEAVDSPPQPKCAKFADLADMLKAVEREHGADAPDTIRPRAVAALAHLGSSHYRAGLELYSYHQTLHHGAWLPALAAMSATTTFSVRTLQEIVAQYEKVKDKPREILEAMSLAGIDPAAPKRAALLRCAVQEWLCGRTAEKAVELALNLVPKRRRAQTAPAHASMEACDIPLTLEERSKLKCRGHIIQELERVDQNRKVDIFSGAAAEALWHFGAREPVTIVPAEPVYDLSGRRK